MAILTRRIFRATPTEKENKVATPIQIDDVNVLVSGQGGDGSLTVTNMLGSLLRARGMGVYTEREKIEIRKKKLFGWIGGWNGPHRKLCKGQ